LSTPHPSDSQPHGILVADDEDCVRALLARALPLYGFRVWVAHDGQGAVELFWRHAAEVDAVLLDVLMPGLDGPATLRELRALAPGLPCLFMTGYTGADSAEGLLAPGGGVRVLGKPFALEDLVAALRDVCGRVLAAPHAT
jgi:two-component system cell cycle sensor histidine kinase/response regulator CckA